MNVSPLGCSEHLGWISRRWQEWETSRSSGRIISAATWSSSPQAHWWEFFAFQVSAHCIRRRIRCCRSEPSLFTNSYSVPLMSPSWLYRWNSVLERYYDDSIRPRHFSVPNFMKEITLSYALLFRFDSRAQHIYKHRERKRASGGGLHDPLVDTLCTDSHFLSAKSNFFKRRPPVRESINASSDFPILSSRLLRIQEYIDSIQPNRISSLWRDKRDILRWYTFWAVVILGAFNVIIAVVQTSLASAQVQLARQALAAQLESNKA